MFSHVPKPETLNPKPELGPSPRAPDALDPAFFQASKGLTNPLGGIWPYFLRVWGQVLGLRASGLGFRVQRRKLRFTEGQKAYVPE